MINEINKLQQETQKLKIQLDRGQKVYVDKLLAQINELVGEKEIKYYFDKKEVKKLNKIKKVIQAIYKLLNKQEFDINLITKLDKPLEIIEDHNFYYEPILSQDSYPIDIPQEDETILRNYLYIKMGRKNLKSKLEELVNFKDNYVSESTVKDFENGDPFVLKLWDEDKVKKIKYIVNNELVESFKENLIYSKTYIINHQNNLLCFARMYIVSKEPLCKFDLDGNCEYCGGGGCWQCRYQGYKSFPIGHSLY